MTGSENHSLPSRAAAHLPVLVAAIVAGLVVVSIASLETKWFVIPIVALLAGAFFMVMPAKRALLTAIFILSLQVDVYLRLLYGRAGSTEGIAIPMVVIIGSVLVAWDAAGGRLGRFEWGGSMRLPIIALFATTCLSLLTTSERFAGLSSLWYGIELYFVYWVTFNLVRSRDDFRRISYLLLATLAAQSIVYYVQSALGITFNFLGDVIAQGDIPRPGGTVSANPAGFTSFIMPALMMAGALALAKPRYVPRPYALALVVLGASAIGLSFTRAAWAGFGIGLAAVIVLGLKRRIVKLSMVLGMALLGIVGGAMLYPTMLARITNDYGGSSIDPTTAAFDERLGLMQIAFNVITAHPVTGIGPGAYDFVFRSYTSGVSSQWLNTVHNEFLLRAAETGIPGAVAFAVFLAAGLRVALRLSRRPSSFVGVCAIGWFGGLIALIWQMNWVPWTGFSYNAMLWLMLGLMDAAQRVNAADGGSLRASGISLGQNRASARSLPT